MGAISGPQPIIVELQNLQPGTVYHYRLLATNGGGNTYGSDMTLTTAEYPVSVIAQAPRLAGPPITFPTESGPVTATTTKALTNAQKLGKALKACHARKGKQRTTCEAAARKKYGSKKKKRKRDSFFKILFPLRPPVTYPPG